MMARDADRRFQSAGEVAESLGSSRLGRDRPSARGDEALFRLPAVQSVEMRHRVCQGRVALGRRYLAAGRQAMAIREADTAIRNPSGIGRGHSPDVGGPQKRQARQVDKDRLFRRRNRPSLGRGSAGDEPTAWISATSISRFSAAMSIQRRVGVRDGPSRRGWISASREDTPDDQGTAVSEQRQASRRRMSR